MYPLMHSHPAGQPVSWQSLKSGPTSMLHAGEQKSTSAARRQARHDPIARFVVAIVPPP